MVTRRLSRTVLLVSDFWLCVFALSSVMEHSPTIANDDGKPSGRQLEDKFTDAEVWSLIHFDSQPSTPEEVRRHVKKVTLVFNDSKIPFRNPKTKKHEFFSSKAPTVVIEDEKLLEAFEAFLHDRSILKHPVPQNTSGFWGGRGVYARMTIETGIDEFQVTVSDVGFGLGQGVTYSNQFFSWGLAKLVDAQFFKGTSRHIPDHLFDRLSGERVINNHKSMYEMLPEELRNSEAEKE